MDEFSRLDDVLIFREIGDQRYIGVYNFEAINAAITLIRQCIPMIIWSAIP